MQHVSVNFIHCVSKIGNDNIKNKLSHYCEEAINLHNLDLNKTSLNKADFLTCSIYKLFSKTDVGEKLLRIRINNIYGKFKKYLHGEIYMTLGGKTKLRQFLKKLRLKSKKKVKSLTTFINISIRLRY